MPYIRLDKVSSICLVRNRYRGSGLTLNGFSFSSKNLLYMVASLFRDADVHARCQALNTLRRGNPRESFASCFSLPPLPSRSHCFLQACLLDLVQERLVADLQLAGRSLPVPMRPFECLRYQVTLRPARGRSSCYFQWDAPKFLRARAFEDRQFSKLIHCPSGITKQYNPPGQVFQLPDVPGPVMASQEFFFLAAQKRSLSP